MPLFLVTGGCGFIGSHLTAALIGRGDRVRVLDDLSTGSRDNLVPGAELVVGDVADAETVRQAMEGVDGCFHLAAIASVERGVQDWLGTHRVNLTGMIAVLEAARPRRVPVVYASSAAVYGDQAVLPIREDVLKRPLSAYGADKLGCEQHALVGGLVHGIPTLGLRFFNVFGPRQDPRSPYSGVISIFCDRVSRGESVSVFGDGGQTRDFVYVEDVVAAIVAAMAAASPLGMVYNVCTGQPTSVRALAETVAAVFGVPLEIAHAAPRAGEIRDSLGDSTLMRERLGLGETRSLHEGLAEVRAWLDAGRPGAASSAPAASKELSS
ncbi:NAD-dependent epimerase/dehydratase family protein [Roseomonas sp. WA12]